MKFEKNILVKSLSCVFILILSLNTTELSAQVNTELEMKISGVNKVQLKHIDSFKLLASITNKGSKPVELNNTIINSEYFFQNGICWELQISNNDVFIPYDSLHTFNIKDINYFGISYDYGYLTIDSHHKYVFKPFEVYTPNKSGTYRVRLIYKNSENSDKYSDWFYIYGYKRKREWRNHKDVKPQ